MDTEDDIGITYPCRSCGRSYELEDLTQGICPECEDRQEFNYIRGI
jgi:DNA-directed RNA polymerase subunit RPC12/RpoP